MIAKISECEYCVSPSKNSGVSPVNFKIVFVSSIDNLSDCKDVSSIWSKTIYLALIISNIIYIDSFMFYGVTGVHADAGIFIGIAGAVIKVWFGSCDPGGLLSPILHHPINPVYVERSVGVPAL